MQQACAGTTDQQWKVTTNSAGYVALAARVSGECLDVSGGSTANSAAIITYACSGATNQQWKRAG